MNVVLQIFDSNSQQLVDYAGVGLNDVSDNAIVLVDRTVYDNNSPTHSRSLFNYSYLKVTKPGGLQFVASNSGQYDIFINPPSLLPAPIVIDNMLIGIYSAVFATVPDAVINEDYYTDECFMFNGVIYKVLAQFTFSGDIVAQAQFVKEISILEVTENYISSFDFASFDAIESMLKKVQDKIWCKIRKNPYVNLCEDKCFERLLVIVSLINKIQSMQPGSYSSFYIIQSEERERFINYFNYLNKDCGCEDC